MAVKKNFNVALMVDIIFCGDETQRFKFENTRTEQERAHLKLT